MKALSWATLLALGALPCTAAWGQSLTESVSRVISEHPRILETIHQRQVDDEGLTVARSGQLPEVNLDAGLGWTRNRNRSSGEEWESYNSRAVELSVRQNLYDGANTYNNIRRQQAVIDSSAYSVGSTAERMALRTTAAYLDVLRDRKLVGLSEDNLAAHRRIDGQIRQRSDSGVGRSSDLSQAEARLALAHSNLIADQGNLDNSQASFSAIVGQTPGNLTDPTQPQAVPASFDEAMAVAMDNHPLLKAARADIEAARYQHESYESLNRPTVDLVLSSRWAEDVDGTDGSDDEVALMLQMRYNLYRGGADQARIRQAAIGISQAQDIHDAAYRDLEEELRLAWASYQRTQAQLDYLRGHVTYTERARRAYREQFDIGERSLLDLLDSENELYSSRRTLVEAERDAVYAYFRIQQAMGQLLPTLGVDAPEAAAAPSANG